MLIIPDIKDFLQPLEDVIHQSFIPALFGRPPCSPTERDLYALSVRLGDLGLINPCSAAHFCFCDLTGAGEFFLEPPFNLEFFFNKPFLSDN